MRFDKVYAGEDFEALGRLLDRDGAAMEAELRGLREPYERFTIPKSQGGPGRIIEAPAAPLKELQRAILRALLDRVPAPPDIHGFVPGRSIVSHARLHRRQNQIVNYDIADAFPSVTRRRVRFALARHIGPAIKHRAPRFDARRREAMLDLLSELCTWEDRLPQGAPTSGALLNLALAPLDRTLRRALARWRAEGHAGLVYSRYADDLNLSAAGELPRDAEAVLRGAIHRAGFRFNGSKIHRADRRRGQPLMVCGLQVDGDALRLPRKTLKRYRAILHRAFFEEGLGERKRAEIQGIAGLVTMVYGAWPRNLAEPWRLLVARHGLEPRADVPFVSGYGA